MENIGLISFTIYIVVGVSILYVLKHQELSRHLVNVMDNFKETVFNDTFSLNLF